MDNTEPRKLAAIMFTDLVDYSAMAQRNEALALALLADSQRLLRAQFPRFNGREVKSTGDGFLVEFSSALQATQCAVEIQRAVVAYNSSQTEPRHIQVRIGLHVGDVVLRESDLYGDGVNIAARIEPLAIGGGICLSDTVYAQVHNKLELPLRKLDSPKLKHIAVPMDVYRVVLPWEPAVVTSPKPAVASSPAAISQSSHAGRFLAFSLLTLVALTAAIWWFVHKPGPASAADQKSIAVLPFDNLSGDPADEYLSDGMADELINVLANVAGLRVPGRTSSFAFKGQSPAGFLDRVGRQLHVTTVLEGSVRKAGEQLKVNAKLINVADGRVLWSQDYGGDMKDILAFQTDVAQRVVQALAVKLGVEETRELTTPPTTNPEAYRLYSLGRYQMAKGNFSGFTNAIVFFNQAISLDPNYALAYCGLADVYGFTAGILMPGREGWAREQALAQKALAIDPNLAEAHFSLGLALASSFHWLEGEKEIKRAIEINPNLAVAFDQYAFVLTCLGRHDEAIAMSKKALALEPLSPLMNVDLGWWYLYARRYDEAVAQCHKALDLDPKLSLARWALGWSLLWIGNQAGAVAEFQQASALEPQPFFQSALGYACAVSGDRTQAEAILRNLENPARQPYVSPGLRAFLYLGLGDNEQVWALLNRAFEAQDYPCQFLKVDRAFDGLRQDPRFQALLNKAGLDQ